MKDETKKTFDAPWYPDRANFELAFSVKNIDGKEIAKSSSPDTVKRIARLPELYDELEQAANEFCEGCLVKHGYLDEEHSYYDLISNGCVLNAKGCKAFPWLKLLQKVRNGE